MDDFKITLAGWVEFSFGSDRVIRPYAIAYQKGGTTGERAGKDREHEDRAMSALFHWVDICCQPNKGNRNAEKTAFGVSGQATARF
jgi:hypothetical protein